MSKCGVCNHDIPAQHVAAHQVEHDMTTTSYHVSCSRKGIKPCTNCGYHRLLCDKCQEICQHKQVVLVYVAGKAMELGGQEKDLLIRCADCSEEIFRMSVYEKEIINNLHF